MAAVTIGGCAGVIDVEVCVVFSSADVGAAGDADVVVDPGTVVGDVEI